MLQLEDIHLTVLVLRISRRRKENNRYKVEINTILQHDHTMSYQSTLNFPKPLEVTISDIWAKHKVPPNPSDKIKMSLTEYGKRVDRVVKSYLEEKKKLKGKSFGSEGSEQSDASSEGTHSLTLDDEELDSDQDDELKDRDWLPS